MVYVSVVGVVEVHNSAACVQDKTLVVPPTSGYVTVKVLVANVQVKV